MLRSTYTGQESVDLRVREKCLLQIERGGINALQPQGVGHRRTGMFMQSAFNALEERGSMRRFDGGWAGVVDTGSGSSFDESDSAGADGYGYL